MLECNFKPFYRSKSFQSKTPHFFERADSRHTKYLPTMCLKKLASNPIRIICQNSKRISLLFFIFVLCQMRLHLFLSCHFMQNKKKPFICWVVPILLYDVQCPYHNSILIHSSTNYMQCQYASAESLLNCTLEPTYIMFQDYNKWYIYWKSLI